MSSLSPRLQPEFPFDTQRSGPHQSSSWDPHFSPRTCHSEDRECISGTPCIVTGVLEASADVLATSHV